MAIGGWRMLLSLVVLGIFGAGAAGADDDPFLKRRQGRLGDALNRVALEAEERGAAPSSRTAAGAEDRVVVVVELAEGAGAEELRREAEALGGRVLSANGSLVKVAVPATSLRALSEGRSVERVRRPFRPRRKEYTGQGVALLRAPDFMARTGATGAGVTVGVLDPTFKDARRYFGSELPADTEVTDLVRQEWDLFDDAHGTACAEIVHDMAPRARLVLATFDDEVTWASALDELVRRGVKVVSHSAGYDNLFPPDGSHLFAQKVDQAAAAGVLFVTAAGNEVGNYFHGTWKDTDRDNLMEFAPGVELLPLTIDKDGGEVVLRWDDPFGRSTHDYDLLVVTEDFRRNPEVSRSNPAIVAFSADYQTGSELPREIADVTNRRGQDLFAVIVHDTSSPLQSNQQFWLYSSAGVGSGYRATTSTLTLPADARGAVAVAAIRHDTGRLEGFSSRGPTADGRVKPDVAGPDGITSMAYEGDAFFGTSAATPHVAGAAALLLSRTPSLALASLRLQLERGTTSSGTAKNNDVGYGLLDLSRVP